MSISPIQEGRNQEFNQLEFNPLEFDKLEEITKETALRARIAQIRPPSLVACGQLLQHRFEHTGNCFYRFFPATKCVLLLIQIKKSEETSFIVLQSKTFNTLLQSVDSNPLHHMMPIHQTIYLDISNSIYHIARGAFEIYNAYDLVWDKNSNHDVKKAFNKMREHLQHGLPQEVNILVGEIGELCMKIQGHERTPLYLVTGAIESSLLPLHRRQPGQIDSLQHINPQHALTHIQREDERIANIRSSQHQIKMIQIREFFAFCESYRTCSQEISRRVTETCLGMEKFATQYEQHVAKEKNKKIIDPRRAVIYLQRSTTIRNWCQETRELLTTRSMTKEAEQIFESRLEAWKTIIKDETTADLFMMRLTDPKYLSSMNTEDSMERIFQKMVEAVSTTGTYIKMIQQNKFQSSVFEQLLNWQEQIEKVLTGKSTDNLWEKTCSLSRIAREMREKKIACYMQEQSLVHPPEPSMAEETYQSLMDIYFSIRFISQIEPMLSSCYGYWIFKQYWDQEASMDFNLLFYMGHLILLGSQISLDRPGTALTQQLYDQQFMNSDSSLNPPLLSSLTPAMMQWAQDVETTVSKMGNANELSIEHSDFFSLLGTMHEVVEWLDAQQLDILQQKIDSLSLDEAIVLREYVLNGGMGRFDIVYALTRALQEFILVPSSTPFLFPSTAWLKQCDQRIATCSSSESPPITVELPINQKEEIQKSSSDTIDSEELTEEDLEDKEEIQKSSSDTIDSEELTQEDREDLELQQAMEEAEEEHASLRRKKLDQKSKKVEDKTPTIPLVRSAEETALIPKDVRMLIMEITFHCKGKDGVDITTLTQLFRKHGCTRTLKGSGHFQFLHTSGHRCLLPTGHAGTIKIGTIKGALEILAMPPRVANQPSSSS